LAARDDEVTIRLRAATPADPERDLVPSNVYDILRGGQVAGQIALRLGDTLYLRRYAGQVGYSVSPDHRGHGCAAAALRALMPIVKAHGFSELWITCNPDNLASRRTAENAGAVYVDTVDLPPDSDMRLRGEGAKRRYRLAIAE
jgi:predicted acetyltransferase